PTAPPSDAAGGPVRPRAAAARGPRRRYGRYMKYPALVLAVALAIILAVGWLSAAMAERRRRGLQARVAAVLVAAPERGALTDAAVPLRRTGTNARARGSTHPAGRLYGLLLEELGATGDRIRHQQRVGTGRRRVSPTSRRAAHWHGTRRSLGTCGQSGKGQRLPVFRRHVGTATTDRRQPLRHSLEPRWPNPAAPRNPLE